MKIPYREEFDCPYCKRLPVTCTECGNTGKLETMKYRDVEVIDEIIKFYEGR